MSVQYYNDGNWGEYSRCQCYSLEFGRVLSTKNLSSCRCQLEGGVCVGSDGDLRVQWRNDTEQEM